MTKGFHYSILGVPLILYSGVGCEENHKGCITFVLRNKNKTGYRQLGENSVFQQQSNREGDNNDFKEKCRVYRFNRTGTDWSINHGRRTLPEQLVGIFRINTNFFRRSFFLPDI